MKIDSKCDCNIIHEDVVAKAKKVLSSINIIDKLSVFYKVFADATRLKILTLLDNVGSMCVCDIAVSVDMTKSAVSHQLNYLKVNNLVKSKKYGKEVMYEIADEHVKDIFEKGVEHILEGTHEKRV